jgi:hypothetical protein
MGVVWRLYDGRLSYEAVINRCREEFGREPDYVEFITWKLCWVAGWEEDGISVGLPQASASSSSQPGE